MGGSCAKIKAGETVRFTANVQLPEKGGTVTAIDFGFDDNRKLPGGMDADFPIKGEVVHTDVEDLPGAAAVCEYTYNRPGIYFAAARVKANRSGDPNKFFTQVKNLARARVIVE